MQFDNCKTNKCYQMLWYLDYLCQSSDNKIKKINLCFMQPGHTKFGPDQRFGTAKINYSKRDILTAQDAKIAIETSVDGGKQ